MASFAAKIAPDSSDSLFARDCHHNSGRDFSLLFDNIICVRIWSRIGWMKVLNSFGIRTFVAAAIPVLWAFGSAGSDIAYARIEASFSITNLTTDPFDYTVTD